MSSLAPQDALEWARSMIQARMISEIFADRMESFVLKGGMAMKVRHKHSRSTQDIDLDSSHDIPLYVMQGLIRRALRRSLTQGLLQNVEITEPKQTETTARWNICGLDPHSGQRLNLTVEVSRRDSMNDNDFDNVDFSPDITCSERPIRVYSNSSLAFKKLKALMADSRDAPRDISDLYLLIGASVDPPIDKIKDWLKDCDPSIISKLWNKIDSMDEERFKTEVLPSLPLGDKARDFYKNWDHIRVTVGTHLEKWILEAQKEHSKSCTPIPKMLYASNIKRSHENLTSNNLKKISKII